MEVERFGPYSVGGRVRCMVGKHEGELGTVTSIWTWDRTKVNLRVRYDSQRASAQGDWISPKRLTILLDGGPCDS